MSQTPTPRSFYVRKDDGSEWAMSFSSDGVRWVPLPGQRPDVANAAPSHRPMAPRIPASKVEAALGAAIQIADMWERRQQRLMTQAAIEESRRTEWLIDMIGRWAAVHAQGDVVDLRLTEYVAREAREMLSAILENKRVALPQSMLYELDSIRAVVRAYCDQLLAQFETLASSSDVGLREAVHASMPQHALDMSFIRALASDPEAEWAQRLASKSTADFDRDLSMLWRDASAFHTRLYPSTELAVFEPGKSSNGKGVVEFLTGVVLPALPRIPDAFYKPDQAEKLDRYRELVLLPAQVSRARALTAAWLSVTGLLEQDGRTLVVEGRRAEATRALPATTVAPDDFQLVVATVEAP